VALVDAASLSAKRHGIAWTPTAIFAKRGPRVAGYL
jgi:hypothetical protein